MTVVIARPAFAFDVPGTYFGWYEDSYQEDDSIVIENISDDEYFIKVITTDPHRGGSCEFTGKGKLIGSSIQAMTTKAGKTYVLPLYLKKDGIIEIPGNDHVFNLDSTFCGAISTRSLDGIFKKK